MTTYLNISGRSNVSAFSVGSDNITVRFKDGSRYLYTYRSAGSRNVEQMKVLANNGLGLNGYINRYVRKNYARKIRY